MTLKDSQIDALCELLEDERAAIAGALNRQLEALTDGDRERVLDRLRGQTPRGLRLPPALEVFHYRSLELALTDWAVSPAAAEDLETPALLLASYGYPLEDLAPCRAALDEMSGVLAERLTGAETPAEAVGKITFFLHAEIGFDGDRENYYDPQNSYLNRVVERRRGSPISLSVVYLLVGRRLGLPLRGVGMPGHFIVKYGTGEEAILLDPFDGGRRLSVSDCAAIVQGLGYHFDVRFLAETLPKRIVERMLNNLIGIAQRSDDEERARQLARYRELVQGN